jgi:hypothetical protein
MGREARARGTFEERRAKAIEKFNIEEDARIEAMLQKQGFVTPQSKQASILLSTLVAMGASFIDPRR